MSAPTRALSLRRSTPSLRDLQHHLASSILDPMNATELDELFALPNGVSALERLTVYAAGYPARMHEALVDAFPAVEHVIGHGKFHALNARYLRAQPPLYYNINDAGAGLPHFLRTDALARDLPFLSDLAQLEWSLVEAFHVQSKPPLDAARLTSIDDWDDVTLEFQPGVRILTSAWPIRAIWDARETPLGSIDIGIENRPDNVLIYRYGYDLRCESIADDEAAALVALMQHRRLGEVAIDLADGCHDAADVASWFARWMELGLIADVTSP